jgi:hypothetical protein
MLWGSLAAPEAPYFTTTAGKNGEKGLFLNVSRRKIAERTKGPLAEGPSPASVGPRGKF